MIAVYLRSIEGPWILYGDVNISAKELAASSWLKMVGGTVVVPDGHEDDPGRITHYSVNLVGSRAPAARPWTSRTRGRPILASTSLLALNP
jgi:hypothetical protein